MLRAICAAYPWDFAQLQLNYLDWTVQRAREQYEILQEYGLPCIVMEPVRGGALASLCPEAEAVLKAKAPGRSHCVLGHPLRGPACRACWWCFRA